MVVDTDTYWYGAFAGRYSYYFAQADAPSWTGGDSACALSWQNRVVPSFGRMTVSVVMTWIGGSNPPTLDMSGTVVPAVVDASAVIDFHGSVDDSDGDLVTVFAVVDDDYGRMVALVTDSPRAGFSRSLTVRDDLQLTVGAHTLKIFAIDQTGTVARASFAYPVEVAGAIATPHASAAPTPTRIPIRTVPESATPRMSRTRSATPRPSGSPYPYLLMEETILGYAYNFELHGVSDDAAANQFRIAFTGFQTTVKDTYGATYYIYGKEPRRTTMGLYIETIITCVGAAALCVFVVTNEAAVAQSVSLSMSVDLMLNGADDAACFEFPGRNGFYALGDSVVLNFFTNNHPLVTDTDTYWFGPWTQMPSHLWNQTEEASICCIDTAMALSWQNRPIDPGKRIVLSTVLTWGIGSANPILNLGSMSIPNPINWETPFTVSGTATDPDGSPVAIIVVADGDYHRLKRLGNYSASGASFSYHMSFQDLDIRGGEHYIDVMAIEITGAVSAPVRFVTTVIAPTLPATKTGAPTPLASPSAGYTRSRTPPPTRTPYATRFPLQTPYPDLRMAVTGDVDPHTNFRLHGEGPSLNGNIVDVSNRGFNSRYRLSTGSEGRLARLETVNVDSVSIGTRVQLIGASAVVAYELRNFGDSDVSVNMTLDTDVNLNERDDAEINRLIDNSGFRIEGGHTHFRVYTSKYPLVVDADTYWFGSFFQLEENLWRQTVIYAFAGEDSAFAVSWQNRVVPAGGRLVLSSLLTWYGDGESPSLNMDSTSLPESIDWRDQFTLSGTVSAANQLNVHLILVLNNDFGNLRRLGDDIRSGSAFSYSFTPQELRLESGKHSFDIYLFDTHGAVSGRWTFTLDVRAPTIVPTHTPRKTETVPATFQNNTPDPTLGPEDGAGGGGPPGLGIGGDRNAGAKAAIGVIVAIAVVIFLGLGFMLWREKRDYGALATGLESTVDIDTVGSYTV
jgi:hypothetical protein